MDKEISGPTYLIPSVLLLTFSGLMFQIALPFAVIALVFSMQAHVHYQKSDSKHALILGKKAHFWCWLCVASCVVFNFLIFFLQYLSQVNASLTETIFQILEIFIAFIYIGMPIPLLPFLLLAIIFGLLARYENSIDDRLSGKTFEKKGWIWLGVSVGILVLCILFIIMLVLLKTNPPPTSSNMPPLSTDPPITEN
jgi:hypothetical protein